MQAAAFDDGRPGDRVQAWSDAVARLRDTAASDRTLRPAVELACCQGLVLRRSQALACGVDAPTLRRLLRSDRWTTPRRGILAPLPPSIPYEELAQRERLLRPQGDAKQIEASAAALARPGAVISHESGALIYGLPVLGDVDRPLLTVVDDDHRVVTPDTVIRCAGMRPAEVTDWFGAPVTTAERVVADISRSSGVAAGLIAADAALHNGLVTTASLATERVWSHYRPGVRTFDRVLELADSRVESPLESLTRLCLVDGGLPLPEPQQWVSTDRGDFRVDLLLKDQRVIIECDGEIKYERPYRDNPRMHERRREEALERAGYVVVRVFWWEIWNEPHVVVARVRRQLARSR